MTAALTNGEWRPVGGILRWFPTLTSVPAFDPAEVACYCGATVTTTCRTKTGHRTADHIGRKPRVCPCGDPLEWGRQICDDCRRAHHNDKKRRQRERRAA